MTEAMLEEIIARRMDALDRKFLSTSMTQSEYDAEVRAIDAEFKPKIDRAVALAKLITF